MLPLARNTLQASRRPLTGLSRNVLAMQVRHKHYVDASQQEFQKRVIQDNSNIVLVDFYANWCRPCHMLSPLLEAAVKDGEKKHGKEIDLMTVDTDREPDLAAQYRVSALPTVMAFKDGGLVDQFVGVLPPAKLTEFIDGLHKK